MAFLIEVFEMICHAGPKEIDQFTFFAEREAWCCSSFIVNSKLFKSGSVGFLPTNYLPLIVYTHNKGYKTTLCGVVHVGITPHVLIALPVGDEKRRREQYLLLSISESKNANMGLVSDVNV